jgi:hypothetical protein
MKQKGLISSCSPEELLGYFMKAEYVVTTSFHGIAFSILFNKKFCLIETNEEVDIRSVGLLRYFDFSDKYIKYRDVINYEAKFDFDFVNIKLEQARQKMIIEINNCIEDKS